jgi:hypothetical protein
MLRPRAPQNVCGFPFDLPEGKPHTITHPKSVDQVRVAADRPESRDGLRMCGLGV